jgi:NitT/TauT family transport system substrate-binding protein
MRIAVPDLVTNSYFPALAAEELGYYAAEGLEAHVELLSLAPRAMAALRDGRIDAVDALNRFALGLDLLTGPVPYEQVVARRSRLLWSRGQ